MQSYSPFSKYVQPCQCEMDRESSWLNDMKEQRLEGIKQEGDCEEGDEDLKLKVGGKQWKRAKASCGKCNATQRAAKHERGRRWSPVG